MREKLDQEELAWAGGFFEGEGCLSFGGSAISIGQTDDEVLKRFQRAVGAGRVNGPYDRRHPKRLSKKPQFFYQLYARASVQRGVALLFPWLAGEKRLRALAVLERAGSVDTIDSPSILTSERAALAWAAGFMDADGCFSYSPSNGSACVAITNTERGLLVRFRDAVGLGKIYGPYMNTNGVAVKSHYLYRVNGFEKVQAILAMLWFKLDLLKKEQGQAVLSQRRAVCHKGHPKRPGHSGCGTCQREYWQTRRHGRLYESEYRRSRGLSEDPVPYWTEVRIRRVS